MALLQPKNIIKVLAQNGQLNNLAYFKQLIVLAMQYFLLLSLFYQ